MTDFTPPKGIIMMAQRVFFVCFSLLLLISCTKEAPKNLPAAITTPSPSIVATDLPVDEKGLSHLKAIMKTTQGNIVFKFYPQKAPNTVTRIIQLIQSGFYNEMPFHRVETQYIIQTGDPTKTGHGGSGYKLKNEINDIPHTRGILAMAKTNVADSADSQFYIALNTLTNQEGRDTVFGKVIEGENLLNVITTSDKILSLTIESETKAAPASH